MDKNILYDFENNSSYTKELLDGIPSGVCLFLVSDEIRFLHFNRAADEMFGYEKGGLMALTQQDSMTVFHPDHVDRLYGEIIATMREGRFFHYACRILCKDGSYRWTDLSAQLIEQTSGGRLYFYCVLSPTEPPLDSLLKNCHFLLASRQKSDFRLFCDTIEPMGGTCEAAKNGLDAFDRFVFSSEGEYCAVIISPDLMGMNGFELAKEIRSSRCPDGLTIPLIFLQSSEDEEALSQNIEFDITAVMQRPLNREALSALLLQFSKTG